MRIYAQLNRTPRRTVNPSLPHQSAEILESLCLIRYPILPLPRLLPACDRGGSGTTDGYKKRYPHASKSKSLDLSLPRSLRKPQKMMSFKISAAFVMLGAASTVSAHAASPLAVAVALENFKNAKIVPDVLSTFNPSGLMTLNFTAGVGRPAIGEAVARTNVSDTPVLMIRGSEEAEAQAGGPFNVTNTPDDPNSSMTPSQVTPLEAPIQAKYPGTNEAIVAYGENHDHTVTLNSTGSPVVAYAAPNPPSGSGPHRYIWLTYAQPGDFSAPSSPAPGSGVALFNLTQYTSAANLGNPIVGTYFTVQEGAANASVASTTAVDSTTLPQYTATATASTNSTHGDGHSNSGAKSTVWIPGIVALIGTAVGALVTL
ncbi:PBP domain-containing protein [Rhizoctonia solani AG-1 IA]|uniref:PBP domain-containing protein n=1 Tax=Thanatephorus cucumeris (strain AG1-IA) TaxID=983506 RepID=L8X2H8_THACA|nr:PBP domain-containing protein [Rhizoctonia solani AG-1 IA]